MRNTGIYRTGALMVLGLSALSAHAALDLRLIGPALSYHEARADLKGREFNEVHPGIGLEARAALPNTALYGFSSFVVMKDSFDSPSAWAYAGLRLPLLSPAAPVQVAAGVMAGVTYKRPGWEKPMGLAPLGGLQLATEHVATGLGLVLTWGPRSNRPQDNKSRDIWTLQTTWRIP